MKVSALATKTAPASTECRRPEPPTLPTAKGSGSQVRDSGVMQGKDGTQRRKCSQQAYLSSGNSSMVPPPESTMMIETPGELGRVAWDPGDNVARSTCVP